jgi:hypothetical protein
VVELRTAASATGCATGAATLTLVATGQLATIEPDGTTLFADDSRVELRGRGLKGAVVHWQIGDRSRIDRCVQPQIDADKEKCAVAVARELPCGSDRGRSGLAARRCHVGADVVTWDATGRRMARDEMRLQPSRFVVSSLVPPDVGLDLAGGSASRLPLVHPEAVAGVDCGAASCTVSGKVIVVGGLANVSSALPIRFRLAPRVVLQRGEAFDSVPVLQVPILPCAMSRHRRNPGGDACGCTVRR